MIELNGELLPPIELPTSDDNDDDNDAQRRPSKKSKLELGLIKMEGKVSQKNGYGIKFCACVIISSFLITVSIYLAQSTIHRHQL